MSERVPNEEARQRIDARRRRRAKGSSKTKLFLAFIAIVCIVLAGAGVYYMQIDNSIRAKDEQLLSTLRSHAEDEPFYMLLLGVDKGEERATDEGYGQDVSNYRADTIMLARIDPQNVKATLVSVHRDTYVENAYAENGYCKINAIYSLLGPAGMVEEVSELASVGINHYAEIDFDAFIGIVDVIGGVEVTLPVDVYDPDYTELDLKAGTHLLNGHDALMLCRCRHGYDAYGDGDRFRAANQRMVIAAIIKKVLASDATTMIQAISAMADSITCDMSVNDILALAAQMRSFNTDTDLLTGMIPTEPELVDGIYYEIVVEPDWTQMMDRVKQGLAPYASEAEDDTAGIAGTVEGLNEEPVHLSGDGAPVSITPGEEATPAKETAPEATTRSNSDISISVVGYPDGRPDVIAESLEIVDYQVTEDADESYIFEDDLIVYNDPALESEAAAINDYLGGGFEILENDGSYYTGSDIVVRLAA